MATIEGLFNFDEKLLARKVAKDNYGAAIGRSAPTGWGPMMMGVNKIGNAIFNTDDKILQEQTIAQKSLQEVMAELGEKAKDNALLYDALGKRLVENGASPETLMKLKQVASNQANDKANVDNANAVRNSTLELNQAKFEETKRNKAEGIRKARLDEFNQTISDEDNPASWLYKNALGLLTNGDSGSKAGQQAALEFNGMVEKHVVQGGKPMAQAIKDAKKEFGAKYKFKKDSAWFSDNSSLQQIDGSGTATPGVDAALDAYK